jgi:hypothetical protein
LADKDPPSWKGISTPGCQYTECNKQEIGAEGADNGQGAMHNLVFYDTISCAFNPFKYDYNLETHIRLNNKNTIDVFFLIFKN